MFDFRNDVEQAKSVTFNDYAVVENWLLWYDQGKKRRICNWTEVNQENVVSYRNWHEKKKTVSTCAQATHTNTNTVSINFQIEIIAFQNATIVRGLQKHCHDWVIAINGFCLF